MARGGSSAIADSVEPLPPSYLHLQALLPTQLPGHPSLQPQQRSATSLPDLVHFLSSLLTSADSFSKSLDHRFQSHGKPIPSPPSTALVQSWHRDIHPSELGPGVPAATETWFARRSRHAPRAERGTATWEEFEQGWWRAHAEQEPEYMSDIFDVVQVADWTAQISARWGDGGDHGAKWKEVGLSSRFG